MHRPIRTSKHSTAIPNMCHHQLSPAEHPCHCCRPARLCPSRPQPLKAFEAPRTALVPRHQRGLLLLPRNKCLANMLIHGLECSLHCHLQRQASCGLFYAQARCLLAQVASKLPVQLVVQHLRRVCPAVSVIHAEKRQGWQPDFTQAGVVLFVFVHLRLTCVPVFLTRPSPLSCVHTPIEECSTGIVDGKERHFYAQCASILWPKVAAKVHRGQPQLTRQHAGGHTVGPLTRATEGHGPSTVVYHRNIEVQCSGVRRPAALAGYRARPLCCEKRRREP